MSIFDGTADIINRSLFGARPVEYQQITALRLLADSSAENPDGVALVRSLYENTIERWREVNGRFPRRASSQNWRFELYPTISDQNHSIEKQVEKRIALLAQQGRLVRNDWANQIPVASGLLNANADKKACVDLAQRTAPACFDLIELKMDVGSGHAVFAAMEALRYGVMYLFARRHARELGYVLGGSGMLGAQRIRLIVLAPASYYHGVPPRLLLYLCDALNAGIAAACRNDGPAGLSMELDFEQLGEPFSWPCSDDQLIEALLRRRPVLANTAPYTSRS